MSKVITWNGISSAGLTGVIIGQIDRSLVGRPRTTLMEVAGKSGAYVFPQPRGTRRITAHVSVSTAAGSAHDAAIEALADWLDVEAEAKLKIGGGSRHYLATLAVDPEPAEWNGLSTMTIEWEAQPYAFGDAVELETYSVSSGTDHIWNAGISIPVAPVIVLTPTNGTLQAFDIAANGYQLSVASMVVASGEDVTINSVIPAVLYGPNDDAELTGAWDPADVHLAGTTGEFPWLIPGGTNQVKITKVTGTATTFDIDVLYRPTYRR